MKVSRTIEGGLRIDAEGPQDWMLLGSVAQDARACSKGLGERLGAAVGKRIVDDWREFVVPGLQEGFDAEVEAVSSAVEAARAAAGGGAGPLWIRSEDVLPWYAALNQARLAIEEVHRFGPTEDVDPSELPRDRLRVFMRSQVYCAIQGILLDLMSA